MHHIKIVSHSNTHTHTRSVRAPVQFQIAFLRLDTQIETDAGSIFIFSLNGHLRIGFSIQFESNRIS